MNNILEGLEPKRVFYYFEQLSKIPRCSYHEEEVSNYMKEVGEKLGLETIQDHKLNVIIRKPATRGYENAKGVIIQGHMDMVCEKEADSSHHFQKDGLSLRVCGDYIQAHKTTLGADNGIALAMGLAILEDDTLQHPDIELLATTAEEVEMDGALGLSPHILKGDRLLNLDSEEEGVLIAGSAGGKLIKISLPIQYQKNQGDVSIGIQVSGLMGGHSGTEIHKPRGNANKILSSILKEIGKSIEIHLISFQGGTKDNAIPRKSTAQIAIKAQDLPCFEKLVQEITDKVMGDYKSQEPEIQVMITKGEKVTRVLTQKTFHDLLFLLDTIPSGVFTRLPQHKEVIESSSNLAIVRTLEDEIGIEVSTRSSSKEVLRQLREKIVEKVNQTGALYGIGGRYPEWEYNPNSQLRDIALQVYEKMFQKKMKTTLIHAGLECGVLAEKYPNLDIISFGPDIFDAHIPKERISISSTQRVYQYLIELLKELK